MEADPTQIAHDFPPFFKVHSSGKIERYQNHDFSPAGHDPLHDVVSKDIPLSPFSLRLYLPNPIPDPNSKLPVIFYVHGGGFSIESAFSSTYHRHLNALAAKSRSLIVSVDYRLAPEHPIPACYDDAFAALQWLDSHARPAQGSESWILDHADLANVFLAGDSAGANIAHNTLIRARTENGFEFGLKFSGLILIHPFFGIGKTDRVWDYVCPGSDGPDDPRLHPMAHPDVLAGLGCGRVLVCVAEKDFLRGRGLGYYQGLKKSGWGGAVEIHETAGESHVFHLFDRTCDNTAALLTRIADFVNAGGVRVMSHV